jgi:hypothetical protein
MLITGDPSSELQQYLHLEGQPSVGISMIWKGFFITLFSFHWGIIVFIRVLFVISIYEYHDVGIFTQLLFGEENPLPCGFVRSWSGVSLVPENTKFS